MASPTGWAAVPTAFTRIVPNATATTMTLPAAVRKIFMWSLADCKATVFVGSVSKNTSEMALPTDSATPTTALYFYSFTAGIAEIIDVPEGAIVTIRQDSGASVTFQGMAGMPNSLV